MELDITFDRDDSLEPSYMNKLQEREVLNGPALQKFRAFEEAQVTEVDLAEPEDEEMELPAWLMPKAMPVYDDVPGMPTAEESPKKLEPTIGEQVTEGAAELWEKATWPFKEPFQPEGDRTNPLARGVGLGVTDAAQGVVDIARDLTNVMGGDFSEEDWVKVPQLIAEGKGSTAESVARGLAQFMGVFGAAGGLAKGATLSKQIFAGALADASFDPTEGNLGTLLRQLDVDNALTQFLDSKVGEEATAEERLTARAKQMLEGAGLGFAVPAIVQGLRYVKTDAGPIIKDWLQGSDPEMLPRVIEKLTGVNPQKGIAPSGAPGTPEDPMIVQHNLYPEALQKHAEHGGDMAMPSLAVTKADQPLKTFGNISLVGDKQMVNPSRSTHTYSSDIFSGRAPDDYIQYKDEAAIRQQVGNDVLEWYGIYPEQDLPEVGELEQLMNMVKGFEKHGLDTKDYKSYREMRSAALGAMGDKAYGDLAWEASTNIEPIGEYARFVVPQDRYTPSGNLKKNKEYSPSTVLKEMRKNKAQMPGTEAGYVGGLSPTKARALTSHKYRNMAEMLSDRHRLQGADEFDHLRNEFSDAFEGVKDQVFDIVHGDTKTKNAFGAFETVNAIIGEVMSGTNPGDWFDFKPGQLDEIKQLIEPLQKMGREMPTEYFESKPNRIVNLGEFHTAVIKKGDTQSRKLLEEAGIEDIIEYTDEQSYLDAFKKNPELFFSKAIIPGAGLSQFEEAQAQDKKVRNVRNNNPGNIKDFGDKWDGMTGTDAGGDVAEGSFVQFETPEHGVRALTKDITNKRKRGLNTIAKILEVYAPEGKENNLKAYISDVSNDVGIRPNTVLKDANMFKLIKAITKHEGGKASLEHFTDSILAKGMDMAYPKRYNKHVKQLLNEDK